MKKEQTYLERDSERYLQREAERYLEREADRYLEKGTRVPGKRGRQRTFQRRRPYRGQSGGSAVYSNHS